MVTPVVYDYALTFSFEIEYIWKRRWTWVSSAFLLVRYGGLILVLYGNCFIPDYLTLTFCLLSSTTALTRSSFIPGPLWVRFFLYYILLMNIMCTNSDL
ncbi:hypothetical protein HD554DRAFT_2059793 [Boletus coccyginus]|nr:hypothetical protein HD554DRAFT_2059793 [Boletus coccyginus]